MVSSCIHLINFILVFCEIALSQTIEVLEPNVALGKPTYQSSVVRHGQPSNAVDGYKYPDFYQQSCIQTKNQHQPWWLVDLQEEFWVTFVVITNRRDCCHDKLSGFEIKIGDSNIDGGVVNTRCAPSWGRLSEPGESIVVTCDEPFKGRYVSIIIPEKTGELSFCEVEVFGRRASSVLKLKLISSGFGETGPKRLNPSHMTDGQRTYTFTRDGLWFKTFDIKTGFPHRVRTGSNFNTYGYSRSPISLVKYLRRLPYDNIVCFVVAFSAENYYQEAVPYLEKLLGQPIKADLEYGESWAFLGYMGTFNPVPHWRASVRRKYGKGPSRITKLITLRKAPSGPPANVKILFTNDSSIRMTWSRPNDYQTNYDYPFNYTLCIKRDVSSKCDKVIKGFEHTFVKLESRVQYSISIRAQSSNMFGDAATLTASTLETGATRINVKLISRLKEDVLYRVYSEPHSSIIVSGLVYNFDQNGHNFLILDAKTGIVQQQQSFDTFEDSNSAAKMAEFLLSLPDKMIILMVVYYRAHAYYKDAAASLTAVCPHAPTALFPEQSNALICLKGLGTASWMKSKISTYFLGPSTLETDILLPKDLFTFPTITKVVPNADSIVVEWLAPETDKFTGVISKYDICYSGKFTNTTCVEIGPEHLRWTVTELHPFVKYKLKMRSAALLSYGPYSDVAYATTMEAAPSGPPTNLRVTLVTSSSIFAEWSEPEPILQNGVIQNYNVCIRSYDVNSQCDHVILPGSQKKYGSIGLVPFTVYDVIVSAATSVGYGPSMLVISKTLEAAPSGPPTNLRAIIVNSTSMTFVWSAPDVKHQNGIIQNYKVCVRYSVDRCKDNILTGKELNYTASGLTPHTMYDVIVSASTSIGYGPSTSVKARTLEAAPSNSPIYFTASFVNSTQFTLTWEKPQPQHHNGILTKYELTLVPEAWSLTSKQTILLPSDRVSYLATNLKPYVTYSVQIRAGTKAGFGPAAALSVRTLMAAPSGPPTFVQIKNASSTSFQVAWSPPAKEKRNGVITSYSLCIREFGVLHACNDTRIVDGTESSHLFTGLSNDREYLVEIRASTKIGFGPSAFVQKMAGRCDNAFVDDPKKIAGSKFSASGYLGADHEPFQARFSSLQIWCENGFEKDAYLQVDIGALLRIIAVATQGDISHFNAWVTAYNLLHSNNGIDWTSLTVNGKKEIQGNTGAGIVKHYLDEPVLTRYIQFKISSFSGPHVCMKVEIFGCAPGVSPYSVAVLSSSATSVEVTWQPSTTRDPSGDILGYVICPREVRLVTCKKNKTYTNQNDRTKLIEGLKPYRKYAIEIATFNLAGEGPSISVVHRTEQAAPSAGPESIEILATTTNSIQFYWTLVPELLRNGLIIAYSLCYQEYEIKSTCSNFEEIPPGSRTYLLSDLEPYKEYLILIRAATVVGWGRASSIRHYTLSAPPSETPATVLIKELSATVLEVTWSPPEIKKRNGDIVAYRLCIKIDSQDRLCHNYIVVGGNERVVPIGGLKPYTWYHVSVQAGTTGGYGPETVVHHRTGEWIPSGSPAEIAVQSFNETSITISWKSPNENEIHGILASYKISIHEQIVNDYLKLISNTTVASNVLSWKFTSLQMKTEYTIEVQAGTLIGYGPPSVVHQRTSGEVDVTYVKKTNKVYMALANVGIGAGAFCFVAIVGFFVFVVLLVKGHVPSTGPWKKRRRNLWREKTVRQAQKRKRRRRRIRSDASEFSLTSSSSNSTSSEDSRSKQRKKRKPHKKKAKRGTTGGKNRRFVDSFYQSSFDSMEDSLCVAVSMSGPIDPISEKIYERLLLDAISRQPENLYGTLGGLYGVSVSTPCVPNNPINLPNRLCRSAYEIYESKGYTPSVPNNPVSVRNCPNTMPGDIYASGVNVVNAPIEPLNATNCPGVESGNMYGSTVNTPTVLNNRDADLENIYGSRTSTPIVPHNPGIDSETIYKSRVNTPICIPQYRDIYSGDTSNVAIYPVDVQNYPNEDSDDIYWSSNSSSNAHDYTLNV